MWHRGKQDQSTHRPSILFQHGDLNQIRHMLDCSPRRHIARFFYLSLLSWCLGSISFLKMCSVKAKCRLNMMLVYLFCFKSLYHIVNPAHKAILNLSCLFLPSQQIFWGGKGVTARQDMNMQTDKYF